MTTLNVHIILPSRNSIISTRTKLLTSFSKILVSIEVRSLDNFLNDSLVRSLRSSVNSPFGIVISTSKIISSVVGPSVGSVVGAAGLVGGVTVVLVTLMSVKV